MTRLRKTAIEAAVKNSVMPRSAKTVTEAAQLLKDLGIIGKELRNKFITGSVSANSLRKMQSASATEKSISPTLHAKALANVDVLFERALAKEEHADAKGNPNVSIIYRLGSVMEHDGKYYPIKITVREFVDSNISRNIYTIEAVNIGDNKTRRALDVADGGRSSPITGSIEIMLSSIVEDVNRAAAKRS